MDIDRRRFLAGLCGVTGGAVAGCLGSRPDLPSDTSEIEIPADAVDITEEGGDPTGERSIIPVLESVAEDGAVVYFPDGEYRLDDTWSFTEFDEFSMLGPKATIVPPQGFDSYLFLFRSRESPATLRFEGFSFDFTAPNTGGRLLDAQISDELIVRDVTATGTADRGPNTVRVDVTNPDGSGLVERLSLPDGAAAGTKISGCFVGSGSYGNIRFTDCHIEGFPDNGLYADPPGGRMIVTGGRYANSGISNVRVRAGSLVENVDVRCDSAREGFDNMRGIRLSDFSPQPGAPPAVVRNCRIEFTDVTSSDGAIVLSSDLSAAEIYDTRIHLDVDDVPALRAKAPAEPFADSPGQTGLQCENIRITGTAGQQATVYVFDRDGCLFDNLCVHQTGPNRDGIELSQSNDNTVQNSYLNITGEPIVLRESTSDISSLRTQPLETGNPLTGRDCGQLNHG